MSAAAPSASPDPAPKPTVLVVDDDPVLLRLLARHLESEGFRVERAGDGAAAMGVVRRGGVDVLVSDIHLGAKNGIDLLREARALDAELPVILVTASPEIPTAAAAVEHGAFRYLCKPVDLDALVGHVEKAVHVRRLAELQRAAVDYVSGRVANDGRLALESSFERALDTLFMAHQPIVDPGARRVVAYEALLRCREPSVPHPGAFLDAAKRIGGTRRLGRRIRASAAANAERLPADVALFVNLGAADLLDDDLIDPAAPLTRHASRVVLEITEREPLDGVEDLGARIAKLRALGFRIALDDLGAGYASLNSFALLEPDVVKLDMSLVRAVDGDATKRKLIGTMLGLCRELRVDVVCEGVETEGERRTLEALGCRLQQGWLFARPGEGYPEPRW